MDNKDYEQRLKEIFDRMLDGSIRCNYLYLCPETKELYPNPEKKEDNTTKSVYEKDLFETPDSEKCLIITLKCRQNAENK